jgi:hypothetical protein
VKPSTFAILLLSVGAGIWWGVERNKTTQLRIQLQSAQWVTDEQIRLRWEHVRLLGLQSSDEAIAMLRRKTAAHKSSAQHASDRLPIASTLQPGVWAAATEWKNRGRSTPESALETMLWAAAGGDIQALKATLEFDAASRAKIAALLADAPESARRAYATPEDLLAVVIAANVPLESALFVARQQNTDAEATAFVRIRDATGATRQVHLMLHRNTDGWALRVPAATVDEIARSLPKGLGP